MKKENIQNLISTIMYILSIIVIIIFIIFFQSSFFINHRGEYKPLNIMLFALLFCITIYLGSLFKSLKEKDNSTLKKNFIFYLITYLFMFYFFTNIDRGVNIGPVGRPSINLIPFKEIIDIIVNRAIHNGELNGLVLIIGNFFVLVPLAYLYPRINQKLKKFTYFIISIIMTTLLIETSQLLFGGGAFDIDDIILNALGPICFYPLLNNSFLSRFLDKVLLLETDSLTKKDSIKSSILIGAMTLIFSSCIYFYWYHDFAISYQITNKSGICEAEKILIYEDDYYKYYGCKNIDDILLIVNETHKYPIKDILDGKVKSRYVKYFASNPKSYLNHEEYFELSPKYPVIEITYPSDSVSIGPQSGIGTIVYWGDSSFGREGTESIYKIMLVPKEPGQVNLVFGVYTSPEHEPLDTITYEVTVDDSMNLTYKLVETENE